MIQLHEELGEALQRSQAVEGLTAITKNSVATNPDQKTREKAKHSVIKDTPKKKRVVIIGKIQRKDSIFKNSTI